MDHATTSAGATRAALDDVRRAPSLLEGMRALEQLSDAAAVEEDSGAAVRVLLAAVLDPTDQLAAMGAVLALGAVPDERAGSALLTVLRDGPSYLRDHAVWALGGCPLLPSALPALVADVAAGDFRGMLAQRTLETWGLRDPDDVRVAVARGLATTLLTSARSRLVETLGLVPGDATQSLLRAVAMGDLEDVTTRATAIAALGDPPPARQDRGRARGPSMTTITVLSVLASQTGPLSAVAQLALDDLRAVGEPRPEAPSQPDDDRRTVAQLFLHADIDRELTQAGRGDTGGIATLLVHLGDALLRADPPVGRVLTLSRGGAANAVSDLADVAEPGHHYLSVPFWGQSLHAARSWPLWVAARRGIRRVLRVAGKVDALHLRMADVGSLAAASAAHELGVPLVVTLAPDPHALVASRERTGELTRSNVGDVDEVEHLVFRDSLLRQLAGRADHVVVFPRPDLQRDLHDLLGVDLDSEQGHLTVVAEGIQLVPDADPSDVSAAASQAAEADTGALSQLDELLDVLPSERRGLPLAVSVGRMHAVKGMATLVESWSASPELSARCNLLLVGGDLAEPNDDERAQLDQIEAIVPALAAAGSGLILAGHRPNATVTDWLAAARRGRGDAAAPGGVYVSASLKEEFGIAILEAMAAGLTVVAPSSGGPATYVTSGVSGVLTDTTSPDALAAAVMAALDLAAAPEADSTAAQTISTIRERFGIDSMAASLAGVYELVASARQRPAAGGRAS